MRTPEPGQPRGADGRGAFALLALLAFLSCVLLYDRTIVPAGHFSWDESAHAAFGLRQSHQLHAAHWTRFLDDTRHLGSWPFLHSWALAIWFLLVEPTIAHARAVSAICFFVFVLVFYRLGKEYDDANSRWAGLLAAAFALTSPMVLVYASQAMLEVPALLAGTSALLAYLKALRTERPKWYWLAGALAAATFFTRYDNGLYVIATLVTVETIRLVAALRHGTPSRVRRRLAQTAALGSLAAVPAALWLLWNPALSSYGAMIWNELTHAYRPYTTESMPINLAWLTRYPISIARDYCGSLYGSALLVLGCALSLRSLSDLRRTTMTLYFCVGAPVVFLHVPFEPHSEWTSLQAPLRHMMALMPALWILASAELSALYDGARPRVRALLVSAFVVAFGTSAWNVGRDLSSGAYARSFGSSPRVESYLEVIGSTVRRNNGRMRVYLIDPANGLAPGLIEWELLRRAPDDEDIAVYWPVWPDRPAEGYATRLQFLVLSTISTWLVGTDHGDDRPAEGRQGYIAAADDSPEFRLVRTHQTRGAFRMKIYQQRP